jgi:hypothetical protein
MLVLRDKMLKVRDRANGAPRPFARRWARLRKAPCKVLSFVIRHLEAPTLDMTQCIT